MFKLRLFLLLTFSLHPLHGSKNEPSVLKIPPIRLHNPNDDNESYSKSPSRKELTPMPKKRGCCCLSRICKFFRYIFCCHMKCCINSNEFCCVLLGCRMNMNQEKHLQRQIIGLESKMLVLVDEFKKVNEKVNSFESIIYEKENTGNMHKAIPSFLDLDEDVRLRPKDSFVMLRKFKKSIDNSELTKLRIQMTPNITPLPNQNSNKLNLAKYNSNPVRKKASNNKQLNFTPISDM